MKLSTKSKYAIIALVEIAMSEQGRAVSLSEISENQNLPVPFLEQIFLKLRRKGIVHSTRGLNGGYALSRDIDQISVLDIIECVEKIEPSTRCSSAMSNFPCVRKGSHCLTHHFWRNLDNLMLTFLKNVSLKDLCDQNFDTLLFKISKEDRLMVSDHMQNHFSLKILEYKAPVS